MKTLCLFFQILFVAASLSAQSHPVSHMQPVATPELGSGTSQVDRATRIRALETYGRLPLSFEANFGQVDPQVMFLSRGAGYSLFLTRSEAVITLRNASGEKSAMPVARALPSREEASAVLRMKLIGANANTRVLGQDELSGRSNYFRGSDPAKWKTNVRQYARVRYVNVYPGADLIYYGNQRELEYDFVLRPGADPEQILLEIEGAKRLRITEGNLVLTSSAGDVQLRRPHIYQDTNGKRREISGRYVVKNGNKVGFEIGAYDRRRSLVIDPVFAYSTYLGGSKEDTGFSIAVDSAGNAYVTGQDRGSTDFPTKNAIQSTYGGGFTDAFVTKINADGSALVYSTYLGGSQNDSGESIAVDSAGNAYVTGQTDSNDFPIVNAIQPVAGANSTGFVTKINAAGSALVFSTYLGGNGGDNGSRIAVDSTNNVYVTGYTLSTDFPVVNAIQPTFGGGLLDSFVTKINAAGSALVYSTYLGGTGDDSTAGIAVDSAGNVYVTGSTSSTNFPTVNAFQPSLHSSSGNAFVTKINAGGTALVYSTYLGGTSGEDGEGISVDSAGNAYVAGGTNSADFPVVNAIQPVLGGLGDAFVAKVNPAGNALVYSTYLGGSNTDDARGIAVDSSGNTYVTGITESFDFPTFSAIQPTYAGNRDLFVTSINAAGTAFIYSTYLGAIKDDESNAIVVDSAGSAYVAGVSLSGSFPETLTAQKRSLAFQQKSKGRGDAFVSKIALSTFVKTSRGSLTFQPQGVGTSSQPLKLTLTNTGSGSLTIKQIYIAGANANDFSETNTCGTSVASGASCTVSVTFTPTAVGKRKGTLAVSDSDPASPQAVALSGMGT